MAAYRRVYDSCHLQADCQVPGSAPEPYTLGNRVWATFTLLHIIVLSFRDRWRRGVVVSGVHRMNEVNPRLARLVPAWVTVFGRIYRLWFR